MARCVVLAKEFGIRLGAHPGPWSRDNFGRGEERIDGDELELLLLHQVGALQRIAVDRNARLQHIKLHGALYHATERSELLARRYLECVARWWPRVRIYAQAGGTVARLAQRLDVPVWEEVFADRTYETPQVLAPRGRPGAILNSVEDVQQRMAGLLQQRLIRTIDGESFPVQAQTVCVHSDTPGALAIARAVRRMVDRCR